MKEDAPASFPEGESFAGNDAHDPSNQRRRHRRASSLFSEASIRTEKSGFTTSLMLESLAYSEIVLPGDGPLRSIARETAGGGMA